jgi:hypothetical protein
MEDKVRGLRGMSGQEEIFIQVLSGKPEGKLVLGRVGQ